MISFNADRIDLLLAATTSHIPVTRVRAAQAASSTRKITPRNLETFQHPRMIELDQIRIRTFIAAAGRLYD
jgi:hypothetical protein